MSMIFLFPEHLQMATFYSLLKIHNGINPLKGRPTVFGSYSISQNLGIYLDTIRRGFLEEFPSYTRDTMDLLKGLEGLAIDGHSVLATVVLTLER